MPVIEKEKHLKWLDFKNQKYYFYLDFCNVTALSLQLRLKKPIKYFSLLLIPFLSIIITIVITIIVIIVNNLLYYLCDFIFNFIIVWHLLDLFNFTRFLFIFRCFYFLF